MLSHATMLGGFASFVLGGAAGAMMRKLSELVRSVLWVGSGQWLWGGARLYGCLFFGFFVLFAVAWMFGFEPAQVSAWLDAHGGLWRSIGNILWRIFCGFVLLICLYALIGGLYERFSPAGRAQHQKMMDDYIRGPGEDASMPELPTKPIGCVGFGAAIVIGYVAWVGLTMPLD